MNDSPRNQTVVVGVDGSAASAAATRWAAAEATRRRARLRAIHVVERGRNGQVTRDRDIRLDLDDARRTMPGRVGGWVFRAGLDVDIAVNVVTGDVAAQLTREATGASLIVIGAPDSLHHSDLPADLANGCRCPLVVVGAFGDVTYVDATTPGSTGEKRARA